MAAAEIQQMSTIKEQMSSLKMEIILKLDSHMERLASDRNGRSTIQQIQPKIRCINLAHERVFLMLSSRKMVICGVLWERSDLLSSLPYSGLIFCGSASSKVTYRANISVIGGRQGAVSKLSALPHCSKVCILPPKSLATKGPNRRAVSASRFFFRELLACVRTRAQAPATTTRHAQKE